MLTIIRLRADGLMDRSQVQKSPMTSQALAEKSYRRFRFLSINCQMMSCCLNSSNRHRI